MICKRSAAVLIAGVALVCAYSGPASAASTASTTVAPKYPTAGQANTLTLSGRGYQSVPKGFGGIYVLFGVVRGTWQPSRGGASGLNYLYIPDSETKDNKGYQKFVAFPGDSTGYAANGGTLAADGTWHTRLTVPDSTITVRGRAGDTQRINCRVEQCGVITIGAHGVVNSHNETFTPVSFARAHDTTPRRSKTSTAPAVPRTPTTTPGIPTPATTKATQWVVPSSPRPPSSSSAPPSPAATATATPAPTSTSSPVAATAANDGTSNAGALAGGIAGAVLLLAAGAGGLWWRRRSS